MKLKVFFLIISLLASAYVLSQNDTAISQDLLIQDVRQLCHILESAHPDPYIKGGGKIAFHLRFQNTLRSIPKQGTTQKEFNNLLLPFVAAVGDGHTRLLYEYKENSDMPGGIPLYFDVVEKCLYVSGVPDEKYKQLIGARLESVEGIQFQELLKRAKKKQGTDNEYSALRLLAGRYFLWKREELEILVPEWRDKGQINIGLKLPTGEDKSYTFSLPDKIKWPLIKAVSKIQIPSTEKCDFVYGFLDSDRKIALLRVDEMQGYREHFELLGVKNQLENAQDKYESYHATKPPEDESELIAGIPSATETFASLVEDMKKAATDVLIVDLRKNGGGNSSMAQFLTYFIFGKETLIKQIARRGDEITKYSKLFFEQTIYQSLEDINKGRDINLNEEDYNFDEYNPEIKEKPVEIELLNNYFERMPTFNAEYRSGIHSGFYRPKKIVVLCSVWTYSSDFTMMRSLCQLGAILIGTPSSQSGNCAGWALNFELKNSHLRGRVACKYYLVIPDPEKGNVYKPDHILTYEKLSSYDFDPNAEILYSFDLIKSGKL